MDTPIDIPFWDDINACQHFGRQLLEKISPDDFNKSHNVMTYHYAPDFDHIVPSQNGFIWATAETHDRDTALNIEVDNIWLAILAQLKPFVLEARRIPEAREIPEFTVPHLCNAHTLAERLQGMVGTTFGPQFASVLMPDFSTTTCTNTVAAALILLGKQCQVQHHRVFSPRRDINDRQHQQVHGDVADWTKLREKLGRIRTWSPKFQPMIKGHVRFLDDMLAKGIQYPGPAPHVTAPAGADKWDAFWAGMLNLIHGRMIVGGWILRFFDPSKVDYGDIFNDSVPSAVATLPVKVDINGLRNCTIIGGFLGHCRGEQSFHNGTTYVELPMAQPMPGWLVYADKNPPAQKNDGDKDMT